MNVFERAKSVLAAAAKGEPLIAPDQDRKELADALRSTREACLLWTVLALEQLIESFFAERTNQPSRDSAISAVWRGLELFCADIGLTPEELLSWRKPGPWMAGILAAAAAVPPDEALTMETRRALHEWIFQEWLRGDDQLG